MEGKHYASPSRQFGSYADFYRHSVYAKFEQEHRASGSFGLTMIKVKQDPIDLVDAAVPDFTFQKETIGGGRAVIDFGEGRVINEIMPRNTITVMLAHAEARYELNYASELLVVALPASQVLPILDENGISTDALAHLYAISRTAPRAVAVMDEMWRCSNLPGRLASLYLDGLTLQFLALVAGQAALSPNGIDRPEDARIARAIDYIEAHLGEALTVGELSSIAALSRAISQGCSRRPPARLSGPGCSADDWSGRGTCWRHRALRWPRSPMTAAFPGSPISARRSAKRSASRLEASGTDRSGAGQDRCHDRLHHDVPILRLVCTNVAVGPNVHPERLNRE